MGLPQKGVSLCLSCLSARMAALLSKAPLVASRLKSPFSSTLVRLAVSCSETRGSLCPSLSSRCISRYTHTRARAHLGACMVWHMALYSLTGEGGKAIPMGEEEEGLFFRVAIVLLSSILLFHAGKHLSYIIKASLHTHTMLSEDCTKLVSTDGQRTPRGLD